MLLVVHPGEDFVWLVIWPRDLVVQVNQSQTHIPHKKGAKKQDEGHNSTQKQNEMRSIDLT